ncbi:MAG: hypothetical protein ACYC9O_00680 [Candidatus Latescibacterota bacterium]
MSPVTHRYAESTACLYLSRLERETRIHLIWGCIVWMLLLILIDRFAPNPEPIQPGAKERTRTVRLIFVTLQPAEKTPPVRKIPRTSLPAPAILPEAITGKEPPEPALTQNTDAPVETALRTERELPVDLFRDMRPFERFPDLSGRPTLPDSLTIVQREREMRYLSGRFGKYEADGQKRGLLADFPLGERGLLRVTPAYELVFFDLFPLEEKPPQDERRRYRTDFFGLSVGRGIAVGVTPGSIGVNALGLLGTGQHLAKTIKWKLGDSARAKATASVRRNNFLSLTKREVRFLVLLWREGRLDTDRLSRTDRDFLAQSPPERPQTYRETLDDMERRGLIASLQVNGRIVFKANFTWEEIVQTLALGYDGLDGEEQATVRRHLEIASAPDSVSMK